MGSARAYEIQIRVLGWFVSLAFVAVLSTQVHAQIPVDPEETASLDKSFSAFVSCLDSKQATCISSSIAKQGVALGADGPRVSAKTLARELSSDAPTQCLLWGTHCAARQSGKCSITDLAHGVAHYGNAYRYNGQLQREVVVTNPSCVQKTSFIFQFENGFWRVVAIPYI